MTKIIACDPGAKGCLVEIDFNEPIELRIKRSLYLIGLASQDFKSLHSWLLNGSTGPCIGVIEQPLPVARGIGTGLLTQGANYGSVLGLMKTVLENVHIIKPSDWQSALCISRQDSKHSAFNIAKALVLQSSLIPGRSKMPHEGLVDAVLIGYYAYLNFVKTKRSKD